MIVNQFFREYVKSPFFWWGIVMLTIITFDASIISSQIFQALLINQLYIPILFGSLTTTIFISTYPFRKGLKEYSRAHDKKLDL